MGNRKNPSGLKLFGAGLILGFIVTDLCMGPLAYFLSM